MATSIPAISTIITAASLGLRSICAQKAKLPLPAAFKPTKVNGVSRYPLISGRQRAKLRKEYLLNNAKINPINNKLESTVEWPFEHTFNRPLIPIKFKGHKSSRLSIERWARINQSMAEMPKKIEEYYKTMRDRRYHDTQLNRLLGGKSAAAKRSTVQIPKTKAEKSKAAEIKANSKLNATIAAGEAVGKSPAVSAAAATTATATTIKSATTATSTASTPIAKSTQ